MERRTDEAITIKRIQNTQQTIALSSGETELYALTKAATRVAVVISLAADFGIPLKGKAMSDSNAAIGITARGGIGRTRHIQVQHLWRQQESEAQMR